MTLSFKITTFYFCRDAHSHHGVQTHHDALFRCDVRFHYGVPFPCDVPSHWHDQDLRGAPCVDGVPDGHGVLCAGDALCEDGVRRADGFLFLNFQCS